MWEAITSISRHSERVIRAKKPEGDPVATTASKFRSPKRKKLPLVLPTGAEVPAVFLVKPQNLKIFTNPLIPKRKYNPQLGMFANPTRYNRNRTKQKSHLKTRWLFY
jgi:hypothetical protein